MAKRILVLTTEMHAKHWYRLKSFLPYISRNLQVTIVDYSNMVNNREGYRSISESLLTLIGDPGEFLWSVDDNLITTTSFLPTDYGKLLCTPFINALLRVKLEEKHYDAILATPFFAGLLALGLRHRLPVVYEDVDRFYEFYKNPFIKVTIKALEQYVIKNSDYVIAVSDILMEEDLSLRKDKNVSLIPNGVNLELIRNILRREPARPSPDNKALIYVGAIEEWAGIDRIIEAFSLVVRRDPSMKLIIIGDIGTRYSVKIIGMIKELGIKNRVFLVGRKPYEEVITYLSRASIGIALFKPSNLTNKIMVPLKILEYSAVGLPFIASDVGSIRRIIEYYDSGLIVDYNDIEDIADKILLLNTNRRLWENLSNNAKSMALDFDVRKLASREIKIIERIVEEKK